jgi:hypothetical protein
MGLFDDIQDAKAAADGGAYITAGHYFTLINRVKADKSTSGAGEFVAIEMTNLATLSDGDIPLDENFEPKGQTAWHRPGEPVTHLMMGKHASFQANFKAFVMAVGDIPESKVTADVCKQVTSGLFEGLFVEIRARTIRTRGGKPFTRVSYVREVPPAEIAERVSVEDSNRILGVGKIDQLIEAYGA